MHALRQHRTLISLTTLTTSIAALSILSSRSTSPIPKSAMSTTAAPPNTYPTLAYKPRHPTFPYTPTDLTPSDTNPDTSFYSSPRYVTHIDDHAISLLRAYYSHALPQHGRILDLCTSWISHFPPALAAAATASDGRLQVAGVGMSAAEMRKNDVLQGRWAVHDLNATPEIPAPAALFSKGADATGGSGGDDGDNKDVQLDATTCVVSIDYLTSPVAVLSSILAHTRVGGTAHLVISNRCFPTKAVRRWLRVDEAERLQMVGDYLWFAGWRDVEILTLSDGTLEDSLGGEGGSDGQQRGGMSAFMRMLGMAGGGCDPLWVVRGKKVEVHN